METESHSAPWPWLESQEFAWLPVLERRKIQGRLLMTYSKVRGHNLQPSELRWRTWSESFNVICEELEPSRPTHK